MSWLSSWLHELILVVLMAAFVEMLLPSKSMERYARLVLSLLVLLTMLSPIISLLKGDASKELTVAMQQQERSGGLLNRAEGAPDSLDKILADGRMLAAGARDQSLKLAAEEIAGQMRDQIAGSTGLGGVKVTVALAMGPNPNAPLGEEVPLISSVTVALPPEQSASGGAVQGGAHHPSRQSGRYRLTLWSRSRSAWKAAGEMVKRRKRHPQVVRLRRPPLPGAALRECRRPWRKKPEQLSSCWRRTGTWTPL